MSRITTRRYAGKLYLTETTDSLTVKTWGPYPTVTAAIRDARAICRAYGATFAVSVVGSHR